MATPHPSPMATLAHQVRPADGVLFRKVEGEAVLLHLDGGIYFGLDPVGVRVWELYGECEDLRGVLQRMSDEYDAPRDDLQRDLLALTAELIAERLVCIVPS